MLLSYNYCSIETARDRRDKLITNNEYLIISCQPRNRYLLFVGVTEYCEIDPFITEDKTQQNMYILCTNLVNKQNVEHHYNSFNSSWMPWSRSFTTLLLLHLQV